MRRALMECQWVMQRGATVRRSSLERESENEQHDANGREERWAASKWEK